MFVNILKYHCFSDIFSVTNTINVKSCKNKHKNLLNPHLTPCAKIYMYISKKIPDKIGE